MQPSHAEASLLIQEVVLGERAATAPEVQAALAAFPELAAELRDLEAIQRHLDADVDDAAEVERQAHAGITADDRRRLQQLVGAARQPRRTWRLWTVALLLAGIAFAAWRIRGAPATPDGLPASAARVVVDKSGATWSIDPGLHLPPGAQYVVTLEIDGRAAFSPQPFAHPIQLPPAWQQAIDGATAAELLVEQPGLPLPRRVALR
jgi:hypothetical protein